MLAIIVMLVCVLLVAVIFISNHFFIRLPILTKIQGVESFSGKVTGIKSLTGGIHEVTLTSGLDVDPELQKGSMRMVSASVGYYVHYRRNQQLPKIGDKISVGTFNVLFWFKDRSYNFVQSSKETLKVLPSGRVVLGSHDPHLNEVDWEKTDIIM